MGMQWHPERVDLLKKLWDENLSASQIAAQMRGLTRNAVIGKAHRLGLDKREKTHHNNPRPVRVPKPRAPRPKLSPVPIEPVPIPEPVAVTYEHIVQFAHLRSGQCHYPLWSDAAPFNEQWYCGAPLPHPEGRPYCLAHARIMYQPRRPAPTAQRPLWAEVRR